MIKEFTFAAALCAALCAPAFADHSSDVVHDHGHNSGHDTADMIMLGDIHMAVPSIRATPPKAPAAGGFLSLTNTGTMDDTLISAAISEDVARMVQLHEMTMDGDVMRMSEVPGGIALPAGETVMLRPGGLHIMLMGLTTGLSEGETHALTLTFEKAGEITVDFPVLGMGEIRERMGAKEMMHDHQDDEGEDDDAHAHH